MLADWRPSLTLSVPPVLLSLAAKTQRPAIGERNIGQVELVIGIKAGHAPVEVQRVIQNELANRVSGKVDVYGRSGGKFQHRVAAHQRRSGPGYLAIHGNVAVIRPDQPGVLDRAVHREATVAGSLQGSRN